MSYWKTKTLCRPREHVYPLRSSVPLQMRPIGRHEKKLLGTQPVRGERQKRSSSPMKRRDRGRLTRRTPDIGHQTPRTHTIEFTPRCFAPPCVGATSKKISKTNNECHVLLLFSLLDHASHRDTCVVACNRTGTYHSSRYLKPRTAIT